MKALVILIILFGYNLILAQEHRIELKTPTRQLLDETAKSSGNNRIKDPDTLTDNLSDGEFRKLYKSQSFVEKSKRKGQNFTFLESEDERDVEKIEPDEINYNAQKTKNDFEKINILKRKFDDSAAVSAERFHWKPALIQSGMFLGIQHGVRLFQKRTNSELGGPFFTDWKHSVKNLRGWADGDIFFINYVAHPLQGAATGRIFVNNSDKSKKLEFGKSKDYWTSRMKTMAWSAVWSTQFEIGPISEASIGNVGIHDDFGRSRMGWVDLVMTPTAGTGVLIGEDIIDKYVLKNWLERTTKSRTKIKVYRTFLNPISSFVNLLGGKKPWTRYNR